MPFPSLGEVLLPPFPSLSYGSILVEEVESYTSVLRLGWVVGKCQSRRPGEGDAVQQTQLQLSSPEHPLHARACGERSPRYHCSHPSWSPIRWARWVPPSSQMTSRETSQCAQQEGPQLGSKQLTWKQGLFWLGEQFKIFVEKLKDKFVLLAKMSKSTHKCFCIHFLKTFHSYAWILN